MEFKMNCISPITVDYEKKYKEVIQRARFAYKDEDKHLQETLKRIFPELKEKESEDEKIRKELIKFVKVNIPDEERYIAWLEKQGDNQNWKPSKEQINALEHFVRSIGESGYASPYDNNTQLLKSLINDLHKLEKQGYQKFVDKVDHKFKIGEWVVLIAGELSATLQIVNIDTNKKRYLFNDNSYLPIVDEECLHLWTIEDAKPGDVLVCKGDVKYSNGIKHERICLFNNLNNAFFTLTKTSNYVKEYDVNVNIDYPDNTVPATKEQKEILFMAMKEAGWEFNFEKKVLKKIGQEPVNYKKRLMDKMTECIETYIRQKPTNKVEPKFKPGDTMRTLQEANDGYTGGMPVVVSIDNEYYHCTNELIAIKDQDNYEFPPMNVKQKHDDKPKFHEGDWVVWDNKITCHIDNIYQGKDSLMYLITDTHNMVRGYSVKSFDNNTRLWTISDAKDGDILVDKSGGRECPFIFKGTKPSDIKTDMLQPLTALGYCGIGGAGFTKSSGWGDTVNCTYYPATKEQRNTLMKAITDAGYTFDFNKKELKKIDTTE